MEHNSVVLSHPKSTGIPQIYGLSTGPPDLKCHNTTLFCALFELLFMGLFMDIVRVGFPHLVYDPMGPKKKDPRDLGRHTFYNLLNHSCNQTKKGKK